MISSIVGRLRLPAQYEYTGECEARRVLREMLLEAAFIRFASR